MSALLISSLRLHSSLYPAVHEKCQHVTQNLLRNQRRKYYLSTNHKLFSNHLNATSTDASEQFVITKPSKSGHFLLHRHVAPFYLGRQVQGVRNFSTHQIEPLSMPKPQGFWQTFVDNPFVDVSQDFLIWLHVNSTLPWWGTIVLSAVLLRNFVTLPITIYTGKLRQRAHKIQKQLSEGSDDLSTDVRLEASRKGWTEKHATRVFDHKLNRMYKAKCVEENCHPFKIVLLPLMQIPPWLVLSISIRKFCAMLPDSNPTWIEVYQQMASEGFLWINNLTLIDPYFILPLSLFVINLTLCEVTHSVNPNSRMQKYVHNFFRLLALTSGCIACIVPSGVVLFWTSTSGLALGHHFITKKVLKEDSKMTVAKLFYPKDKITDVNSRLESLRKNKLKQK